MSLSRQLTTLTNNQTHTTTKRRYTKMCSKTNRNTNYLLLNKRNLDQHLPLSTAHMCVCVCTIHTYHCAQLEYTIQHKTILVIFPLILQTIRCLFNCCLLTIIRCLLTGSNHKAFRECKSSIFAIIIHGSDRPMNLTKLLELSND